jgi:hypothetical protein
MNTSKEEKEPEWIAKVTDCYLRRDLNPLLAEIREALTSLETATIERCAVEEVMKLQKAMREEINISDEYKLGYRQALEDLKKSLLPDNK